MLRPFFSFYGGKWRDTPKHYPTPKYNTIVEPFAGSAGYSVRHADKRVLLFDADPIVVGVWSFLIASTPENVLAIPDLEPGQTTEDLKVCQEVKWLVGFWLNRAPSAPRKSPSSWMRSGVRPGSFWGERVRSMLASQVNAIKHWRITLADYSKIDVPEPLTWFVDPPYQNAGKHYRFGSDHLDFEHIGAWCKSRRGQTIVCENHGATWLPFERLGDVKTTRSGARSVEVCWIGDE